MTLSEFDAYFRDYLAIGSFPSDPSRNGIQCGNRDPDGASERRSSRSTPARKPYAAPSGGGSGRVVRAPRGVVERLRAHYWRVLPPNPPGWVCGSLHRSESGAVRSDELPQAAEADADVFITGEIRHEHYHAAEEAGITVIAAGHYRTETVGVSLLAEKLRAETDMEAVFIDVPTGS